MNVISLIGRTNSGKSTLFNSLIGKKIAAIADKVNTTRIPLTGIYHHQQVSWLILDAPGVCKTKTNLDKLIFYNIHKVIELGNLIWWMISSKDQWRKDNQILGKLLTEINKPVFLLINMIDLISQEQLLKKITFWKDKFPFLEIIPLSAKKKLNFANLIRATEKHLKINQSSSLAKKLFTLNSLTDLVQEVIREEIVNQTSDELPHQTTLIVDHHQTKVDQGHFYFTLVVATKSQKAIILGKQGKRIRSIRVASQKTLTRVMKKNFSLFITVKVHKNWYQDRHFLKKLPLDWNHHDYF